MPKMFHRPSRRATGQKAFLAVPTYSGLAAGFSFALFHSADALKEAGIQHELALYSGDCHVDDARNRLVRDFLETDCTDLVFIDADLRWEPSDLVKLLKYDRDVVGSTYPFKADDAGYPVALMGGEAVADEDGLLEVYALPTGFLRIKRHVLQTLADKAVKFHPKSDERSDFSLIFERQVHNGNRRGGDYAFCNKWRELGGKIHFAPEFEFEHFGEHSWTGSFGHWKRLELYGPIKAALLEVKHGVEKLTSMNDLAKAWGNDWQVSPDALWALAALARSAKGDILEAGSGLTTLVMAAASKHTVVALEHEVEWADKVMKVADECGITNIAMCVVPLVNGWYDVHPSELYALALCDGPPRKQGDRSIMFSRCEKSLSDAVVVIDDTDGEKYWQMAQDGLPNHDMVRVGRMTVARPKPKLKKVA